MVKAEERQVDVKPRWCATRYPRRPRLAAAFPRGDVFTTPRNRWSCSRSFYLLMQLANNLWQVGDGGRFAKGKDFCYTNAVNKCRS